MVAGIDEAAKAIRTAEVRARREIVKRSVVPVKIELGAGDRHEFQAVHSQALKICEAVYDAVESVVELLDMQFVNDQIVQVGCLVQRVGPSERQRIARKRHGGQETDLGLPGKRVREPTGDKLARTSWRRPPELETV